MDSFAPVQILYEDNHVLAAVKPPGVLSQADAGGAADMLTVLKGYLKEKYQKPGKVFLGLVHRLDRPVGGVMVFAKTSKCAARLSAQIRNREVSKSYLAVVAGRPPAAQGSLCGNLLKDRKTNVASLTADEQAGKPVVLHYELAAYEAVCDLALLRIRLDTGRPHQIRVQLSAAGCPVYGDRKYNPAARNGPRADVALWSYSYAFCHPTTRAPLVITAAPPQQSPWHYFDPSVYHSTP